MDAAHVNETDLTERWGKSRPGTFDFPVETTRLKSGSNTGSRKARVEQVLMVVSGTAKAYVGREERQMTPGSTLLIPPCVSHDIHNIGDQPLSLLRAYAEQPA
jgi:mannose-6-phosphate isomerase-like protein (cupin superfamily)